MTINKNVFFKIVIILLLSISFFLGYFFRENSAGGGTEFYQLSWPIIQSFREDFLFTIKNYGTFRDYTIPFSHILNAYLNPFSDIVENFQLFNTIISFGIFFTFALVLKKIFLNVNFIDILLTASVFLVLPFFRTSAFWGKNENYGWFFLILAFYFFSEIKKNLSENPGRKELLIIVLFCFTSACALYARQALAFLPISFLLYLFFYNANKKIIITSIIAFTLFATPSLLLIITWGNVFDTRSLDPGGSFFGWWIHPSHILKNLPILLSFFGFYLLPILIIEFISSKPKNFFQEYFKNFSLSFIFFVILLQMGFLNYLGEYKIAGGAILKLNYLIEKNNFLLLLIFSSLGFSIIMRFLREDIKNNLFILFPIIIIYSFPNLLYQEYVEPLIIIIFFLALNTNLHKIYFKNIFFSNFIFISYFAVYLVGSIYFKHFAFSSFEEWKIFLGVH